MSFSEVESDRTEVLQVSGKFGKVVKRAFDIGFALMALSASFIVMIIIALVIKFSDRGPVFFAQKRIGKDGAPFGCLKFRTMVADADAILARELEGNPEAQAEWDAHRKLRHDPRVTPVGRVLRKFSLDELPQFVNVLVGDMSVVGPRPITREELHLYGNYGKYYLAVKPGITGAWQVSGRSGLHYDERVVLDATYVKNWTFWRDIKIVVATIGVVVSGSDSY